MRSIYEERVAETRKIEGQLLSGRDKIVPPNKFKQVCKVLWPDEKLAPFLAGIAGCDERTAKRWLSGEYDPPISVVLAVVNTTFKSGG